MTRTWGPLLALFGAGPGRAVAARWVALVTALALPGAIFLGGNGVRPHDVAGWFATSVTLRALVFLAFTLLTTPVVAPALLGPGTLTLRSLPVNRAALAALIAGSAALTQLPLAILLGIGGSPGAGLALAFGIAAAALVLAGRVATRRLIAALVAAAALIIEGAPSIVSAPMGAALLGAVAFEAWIRAPEHAPRSGRPSPLVSAPPVVALAGAHWLRLLRQETPVVIRGLLLVSSGGLATAVVARNVGAVTTSQIIAMALAWGAIPFAVAASGACAPVLDSERRLRWMIDTSGAPSALRHEAAALVMAGVGTLAGLAFMAGFFLIAHLPLPVVARVSAASSAWGAALALAVLAWGRAALRDERGDRTRFVIGSAGLGGAAIVAAVALGEGAAYVALALSNLVAGVAAFKDRTCRGEAPS